MKLKIIHETTYQFDKTVFLEPHYFRFKPDNRPYLNLEHHEFKLNPSPAGISHQIDPEDNEVLFCWFDGNGYSQLHLKASSIVETTDFNPFNFIIQPSEYQTLPFHYDSSLETLLGAGLQKSPIHSQVFDYIQNILESSHHQTIDFLTEVTRQIHTDFKVEYRLEGDSHPPNQTFRAKTGAC